MELLDQDPLLPKKSTDLELGSTEESVRYGSVSSIRTAELAELNLGFDHHEVPQGRHLGIFSTIVLFVSRIVGSGIFATPSSIFVGCGGSSVLFFGVWCFAALMAFAGLYLFLEFGSLIPRSGGRKNFLEAVYTKPDKMMSVTFTTFTVLMGMAVSNAIVFGKYVLYGLGYDENFVNQNSKACNYIGAALVIAIAGVHGTSVKGGVYIQNLLGALKLFFSLVISCTGVYAMCFFRRNDNEAQILSGSWQAAFQTHDQVTVSSITTAFIQAFFCFAGWDNVHSVASEIKNPVRTLKIAGPLSLGISLLCYLSLNVAYLRVFTYDEFKAAGPLAGSILFTRLLGPNLGRKLITFGIALSAGSNLFVVVYSVSRMNQECFREGFLPFSRFMASNKPWGAPLPSLTLCAFITSLWLVLLPSSGGAYSYLVAMEGYANQIIILLVAVGLFIYRRKNSDKKAEIRASSAGVVALIILSTYLLIGPFIGSQNEAAVRHLPPYPVTALLLICSCLSFWFVKFVVLPKLLGYSLKREVDILDDGLVMMSWHKVF
ncbi:LANO_0G18096g1_1 [Lachancea nothofagi CBS 11611]|uniref:LANO_0G18096g1_1 n=1 Tax=Lachancea nothofagi CBS 11611 TaxID=1266666 RepID=A0A1G4KKQ7_9SACH|nr:LANO_0G18096g1_1 [Lachancea nothofagi CBS 11611]